MSNIATSIVQSKHLLELGLDPKTADMYYTGHRSIYNPKEIEESESALNFVELTKEQKDKMRDFFNKVKQQIQKNNESKD